MLVLYALQASAAGPEGVSQELVVRGMQRVLLSSFFWKSIQALIARDWAWLTTPSVILCCDGLFLLSL